MHRRAHGDRRVRACRSPARADSNKKRTRALQVPVLLDESACYCHKYHFYPSTIHISPRKRSYQSGNSSRSLVVSLQVFSLFLGSLRLPRWHIEAPSRIPIVSSDHKFAPSIYVRFTKNPHKELLSGDHCKFCLKMLNPTNRQPSPGKRYKSMSKSFPLSVLLDRQRNRERRCTSIRRLMNVRAFALLQHLRSNRRIRPCASFSSSSAVFRSRYIKYRRITERSLPSVSKRRMKKI